MTPWELDGEGGAFHRDQAREWLARAQHDYSDGQYDAAHAASRISVAHAALFDIESQVIDNRQRAEQWLALDDAIKSGDARP